MKDNLVGIDIKSINSQGAPKALGCIIDDIKKDIPISAKHKYQHEHWSDEPRHEHWGDSRKDK
jgi:molybdopterin synthase catalytic subunit